MCGCDSRSPSASCSLQRRSPLPRRASGPTTDYPTPRFTQPDRRERLAAAFPEIERFMAGRMASDHLPGLAFGVVIDGELAFGKGLGVRDVATGAPADLDTAFRIASMTKSFTALAILKLRDEGRLSLEDPVSKHVQGAGRPHLSHAGHGADHDPAAPHAFRGIPRGQPLGRPPARGERRRALALDARRAFPSRPRRARPSSTPTTASRSSARSSRACRACATGDYVDAADPAAARA